MPYSCLLNVDDGGLSTHVIVIIVIACVVFVAISGWLLWILKRKLKGNQDDQVQFQENIINCYDIKFLLASIFAIHFLCF